MSHNWISCRNAPLLALQASARAPFPQGVPCCCWSLRRALNGARGSSQTISLLLKDIPVLIQYHTRLSLCLNPSPCHQLPWTGDLLTAPDKLLPQSSHWGTRDGTAELSLVATAFSTFPIVLLDFQFTSNSKHSYLGSSYLSWQYCQVICFKLHGFGAKPIPYPSLKFIQLSSSEIFLKFICLI